MGTQRMSMPSTSRTTDFVPICSYWEFCYSVKLDKDSTWLEALLCSLESVLFMESEIAKNPGNFTKNYYWKQH